MGNLLYFATLCICPNIELPNFYGTTHFLSLKKCENIHLFTCLCITNMHLTWHAMLPALTLRYGLWYKWFFFNRMCILCKQYGQEHREWKSCNLPKFSERFRPGYFGQRNLIKTALFHTLRGRVCAHQSSWNLTLATIDSYYMLTVYCVKIKSQFSYIAVLGDVPQNHFLKRYDSIETAHIIPPRKHALATWRLNHDTYHTLLMTFLGSQLLWNPSQHIKTAPKWRLRGFTYLPHISTHNSTDTHPLTLRLMPKVV